jgi:xylulokinase
MQRKNDEGFFEEMNALAAKTPIGAEFSLFFPFLQGRSAPAWPEASAAWIGLYGSNNAGTLWRSMLESIAFEYFTYVEILESVGIELKQVIGTGGGSKGRFWNQIKADILDAPYTTLKRTEGAVMGNALLAAHGVGDFKDLRGKIREWVKEKETFTPIEKNTRAYRKIFQTRQNILNGPMREVFRLLADMHDSIEVPAPAE